MISVEKLREIEISTSALSALLLPPPSSHKNKKQLQPIQAINNVPQCPRFPRSPEHHHPCRSIGVLLCNEFIIASSTRQCHYGMVVDWIDRFHVHPFANHHHQPHHRRR